MSRSGPPIWIAERDALAIHDRLLALDGGLVDVRDQALLQSALARPQQLEAYGHKPDLAAMAAAISCDFRTDGLTHCLT